MLYHMALSFSRLICENGVYVQYGEMSVPNLHPVKKLCDLLGNAISNDVSTSESRVCKNASKRSVTNHTLNYNFTKASQLIAVQYFYLEGTLAIYSQTGSCLSRNGRYSTRFDQLYAPIYRFLLTLLIHELHNKWTEASAINLSNPFIRSFIPS